MTDMNRTELMDSELELLFDAARRDRLGDLPPAAPGGLDAALSARIMGDAASEQERRDRAVETVPAPSGGWLGQLLGAIGGWPAMAGLASAAVAGVWIGISPPQILEQQAAFLSSGASALAEDSYLVDVTPIFGAFPGDG